jgi:hypothetical protein
VGRPSEPRLPDESVNVSATHPFKEAALLIAGTLLIGLKRLATLPEDDKQACIDAYKFFQRMQAGEKTETKDETQAVADYYGDSHPGYPFSRASARRIIGLWSTRSTPC